MNKIKQLKFFDQSSSFKRIKEEFNTLLGDKISKRLIQVIFLLLGLDFLFLFFFWSKIPPQVPLFYSRPWGENQLINKNGFLLFPLACLLFVLINLRMAGLSFRRESLLSQILVWSSLIIGVLTSINLFKILIMVL